jgi:hypothetical protein
VLLPPYRRRERQKKLSWCFEYTDASNRRFHSFQLTENLKTAFFKKLCCKMYPETPKALKITTLQLLRLVGGTGKRWFGGLRPHWRKIKLQTG